ncbi:MAG: DUF3846 domain-containing protein [Candidatus Neomarinimicrobiota bacterium]
MRVINAYGTETIKTGKLTLAKAQEIVGGYVEVYNHNGKTVLLNEDGRMIGLPYNKTASEILDFTVVGTVVIGDRNERILK